MSTEAEKPKTTLEGFPADVIGILQDFLPHVQEVASAALAWQVAKLLEVRRDLIGGGISQRQAGDIALELIKSATQIPAPNAIPFGAPMKRPDSAQDGQGKETLQGASDKLWDSIRESEAGS